MIYDEEKARALVSAGIVQAGTARTWKRRGTIPDRYAQDPKKRRPVEAGEKLGWLKEPTINANEICRRAQVSSQCLHDALSNRQNLDEGQLSALMTQKHSLLADLEAVITWNQVLDVLRDNRLFARTIIGKDSIKIYHRLSVAWRGGNANFSQEEEALVKDKIAGLVMDLKPQKQ